MPRGPNLEARSQELEAGEEQAIHRPRRTTKREELAAVTPPWQSPTGVWSANDPWKRTHMLDSPLRSESRPISGPTTSSSQCSAPDDHIGASSKSDNSRSSSRFAMVSCSCGLTQAFSRERPSGAEAEAARRLPRLMMTSAGAICSRRDAVRLTMNEALQRRASVRPLVGCYAE